MVLIELFITLVFSLLLEASIILLLEFYDPSWVNFDQLIREN